MKHLLAYAYLMANFDRGARTPLQVLEGVVARSLARAAGDRSADDISGDIVREWGLSIPIKVVRYSLSSLMAQGTLERVFNERLQEEKFRSKMPVGLRETIEREGRQAQEKYNRIKRKVTAELFREQINLKYESDSLIESWLDGSAISFLGNDSPTQNVGVTELEINRIMAKVIGVDRGIDEEAIADLTDLAMGDVLYRSLRELTEYEVDQDGVVAAAGKSVGVSVFLDVGIISRAFGYYGVEQGVAIGQMLKMIKDVGFQAKVFAHTVDELQEVMMAAAGRLQAGGTDTKGPMVSYALRTGKSASDLVQEAATIQKRCADLGVQTVERPSPDINLTVDELGLERDVLFYVQQENPRARQRDIDSLTSVFRLRHGEAKVSIERCEALFITHNRSLQAAAHHFFKQHFYSQNETNIVQLCMTDVVFSSRLWVKLPTSVNWKPRSQIIACALSNLAPAPGIREGFLRRLREMVAAEKVDPQSATLIEFSRFTQEVLALDYNYGDQFSEGDVSNVISVVIQRMKNGLTDARWEGRRQGIEEEANRFKQFQKEHEGSDILIAGEVIELKDAVMRTSRDLEVAQRLSIIFGKTTIAIVLAILASGTLFTVLIIFEVVQPKISLVIAALTAVGLFAMAWFGLDRIKLLNKVTETAERWLMRRLRRF